MNGIGSHCGHLSFALSQILLHILLIPHVFLIKMFSSELKYMFPHKWHLLLYKVLTL